MTVAGFYGDTMKLYRLCILLLVLAALVVPNFAQDNNGWFVYLFDSVNYELVRVYETGEMEIYSLGLEANETTSSREMAISDDGSLLVFCKMIMGSPNPTERTLIVRDIVNNTNLSETQIDVLYTGCRPTAFNADASQFVLGIAAEVAFDPNTGQPVASEDISWRLQVIDTQSGAILHEINSTTPDAPVLEEYGGAAVPVISEVISFRDNIVIFRGIPYVGMGLPPEFPAWAWDLNSNTISPVANVGHTFGDYLAQTGELVYPALDESIPAAQPGGPMSQANIVRLQTSDGATQTIYQNSEDVIVGTRFVNDGEAIAVLLVAGFDPNNPDTFPTSHVLVDRAGTVTEIEGVYEQFTQIAPVPGGAVITWTEMPEGANPIAKLAVVENSTVREIWSYEPPSERGYSFMEILWSPPLAN
jgi:hypothetical protein